MNFDEKGLIPAIIQDWQSGKVLMLGYMNQEAFDLSCSTGKVCFWSRSKQRLWVKGESSGHYLIMKEWRLDCDKDALLIKTEPMGPTCHTGSDTCWQEKNELSDIAFLQVLEAVIATRKENPKEKSYTSSLFESGINKVIQKLGEEAIELVIEAKDDNKELFLGEAADLLFHYLVLLKAKEMNLTEVIKILRTRHQ